MLFLTSAHAMWLSVFTLCLWTALGALWRPTNDNCILPPSVYWQHMFKLTSFDPSSAFHLVVCPGTFVPGRQNSQVGSFLNCSSHHQYRYPENLSTDALPSGMSHSYHDSLGFAPIQRQHWTGDFLRIIYSLQMIHLFS
jgi:hypothetical protein